METPVVSPQHDGSREPNTVARESLDRGYEVSRVSVLTLVYVLVGFIVVAAGIHVGVWYLEKGLLRLDRAGDQALSAVSATVNHNGAPPLQPMGPAHDTTDQQDLAQMRQNENELFSRAGWMDSSASVVVVPPDVVSKVARAASTQPKEKP